jgi:hypothetical protein
MEIVDFILALESEHLQEFWLPCKSRISASLHGLMSDQTVVITLTQPPYFCFDVQSRLMM